MSAIAPSQGSYQPFTAPVCRSLYEIERSICTSRRTSTLTDRLATKYAAIISKELAPHALKVAIRIASLSQTKWFVSQDNQTLLDLVTSRHGEEILLGSGHLYKDKLFKAAVLNAKFPLVHALLNQATSLDELLPPKEQFAFFNDCLLQDDLKGFSLGISKTGADITNEYGMSVRYLALSYQRDDFIAACDIMGVQQLFSFEGATKKNQWKIVQDFTGGLAPYLLGDTFSQSLYGTNPAERYPVIHSLWEEFIATVVQHHPDWLTTGLLSQAYMEEIGEAIMEAPFATTEKLHQRILNKKATLLQTGYDQHSIAISIVKETIFFSNSGMYLKDQKEDIQAYTFNPKKLTPQLIQRIEGLNFRKKRYANRFIYNSLLKHLECKPSPLQTLFTNFQGIPSQKYPNCVVSNCMRSIFTLLVGYHGKNIDTETFTDCHTIYKQFRFNAKMAIHDTYTTASHGAIDAP